MVVRSKLDYHPERKNKNNCSTNSCKSKDCKYCKLLDKSGNIQSDNKNIESKWNITCNSSNVIYCIECTRCQKRYVGQTKRKIKERLREHLYNIKKDNKTDMSYHFNTNQHKGECDMKVYILDFIYEAPDSKRAAKLRDTIEHNWIHKLRTVAPKGLNIMDNRY